MLSYAFHYCASLLVCCCVSLMERAKKGVKVGAELWDPYVLKIKLKGGFDPDQLKSNTMIIFPITQM